MDTPGSDRSSSQITWVQIITFLNSICEESKLKKEEESFAIIILDEIDKLSTLDNSWQNYIRTEVFKLLDQEVPIGLKDEEDDHIPEAKRTELQKILKSRTMIIAAGAFQSYWDDTGRPAMGFSQTQTTPESISLSTLGDSISRELANRFQSQIVRLPELKSADYENILAAVAKSLPKNLSQSFLAIGGTRIEDAVRHKTGFRFAEEILLEAILSTHVMESPKKAVSKFHPPKTPTF